jgi:hypothetical protein
VTSTHQGLSATDSREFSAVEHQTYLETHPLPPVEDLDGPQLVNILPLAEEINDTIPAEVFIPAPAQNLDGPQPIDISPEPVLSRGDTSSAQMVATSPQPAPIIPVVTAPCHAGPACTSPEGSFTSTAYYAYEGGNRRLCH